MNQPLKFLADIYHHADNKHSTDIIYLDFRRHSTQFYSNELLYTLSMLRITGPLWHWFKNYLSNCNNFVFIEDSSSSFLSVISGILQSSILGPLLFSVYINYIPFVAISKAYLSLCWWYKNLQSCIRFKGLFWSSTWHWLLYVLVIKMEHVITLLKMRHDSFRSFL